MRKKRILFGLVIFLILAQFIRIDKTNPSIVPQNDFLQANKASEEVSGLFKSSCYDCHSNETKYPWYTNVAPFSWWIKGHINNARESLNYSDWNSFSKEKKITKINNTLERIEKKWMPPGSYKLAHPEARLNEENRALMVSWLKGIK